MDREHRFAFGSFHFDGRTGQLWREGSEVKLTPRAAAVLQMLAERSRQLVTKQELFDRLWTGLAVGDDALTSCIQELRAAIGDDARRPCYIETRHRRGYRLLVHATPIDCDAVTPAGAAIPGRLQLVGRVREFGILARCFQRAGLRQRQVVFITGEPGIGKSSLADAFLQRLETTGTVTIAHGQCLDHYGVGEPYLPLIEALTRLAQAQGGNAIKKILSVQAPSWFAEMPSLWPRSKRAALEARGRATRKRMMRELALAVEAITLEVPLLFKLEDLHWSDASTLDFLAHIARRPDPARLMVLATFRPGDRAASEIGLTDLVTELQMHGQCTQIALNPLNLTDIEAYLKERLGTAHGANPFHQIAPLLLERTGGNPLFMTSIVNELAQRDISERTRGAIMAIPQDVRRFIELQIDGLNENDRSLLCAASVMGRKFATAALSAVLAIGLEKVEAGCARLARGGVFIVKIGLTIWPDGTRSELYSFRHDLYRELLYDRLPPTRRALSHARAGHRLDAAWARQLHAIATELAEHFERGNEPARAIPHHHRAAEKALRRGATEEAITHLRQAIDAIGSVADEVERIRAEVELRVALGAALMTTQGFGAPDVFDAYSKAETLCERLGESKAVFPVLWGQWLFRWGRSELDNAWQLCERLLALAVNSGDRGLKLQAHHAAWATSFGRGRLADVYAHAEAGIALYDAENHQAMASSYGNHNPSTCARYFAALSLALAGEEGRARSMADSALAVARSLDDPFSLALTLYFASATAQVLGDVRLAGRHAKASRHLAIEYDLAMPRAWSTGVLGWCTAKTGDPDRGTGLLTEAIASLRATHSSHFLSYLLGLLAEAQMSARRHTEAMQAAEEGLALAKAGGELFYSAELYRLQGELLTRPPHRQIRKAEASFRTAIKIASKQGAATLEQKARESLRNRAG